MRRAARLVVTDTPANDLGRLYPQNRRALAGFKERHGELAGTVIYLTRTRKMPPAAIARRLRMELGKVLAILGLNPVMEELGDAPAREGPRRNATISWRTPLTDAERASLAAYPEDVERPFTRADCAGGPRPCPWVSCRHHLYLDVNQSGSLVLNFPHIDVADMATTCSLDVADQAGEGLTLEETAAFLNVTRERVRQIEESVRRHVVEELEQLEACG